MQEVTLFRKFTKVVKHIAITEIITDIRAGKYKKEIEVIRQLIRDGKKEAAQQKKKQLLAFTVSGKFEGGRRLKNLGAYRPFIILDIDQLPDEGTVKNLQKKANVIPYTFSSFISPSGLGLKIIVQIRSSQDLHATAYEQVANYYQDQLVVAIDRSGKDITRLCYVSYDPQAYLSTNAEVFPVNPNYAEKQYTSTDAEAYQEIYLECLAKTKKQTTYETGNRNNFIYQLGANCNRAGIPMKNTLQFCQPAFDLADSEIQNTIQSAYNNHPEEFNSAALKAEAEAPPIEELLLTTPFLPDELFPQLPELLKESCQLFSNQRERDVFLTSALSILSGCMSHISGIYHGRRTHPNLYTLVLAPAASGKSALNYARLLAEGYQNELLEKSEQLKKEYKTAQRDYQQAIANSGNGQNQNPDPPEKPPYKMLFIPANSSSSRIIRHLSDNQGKGIICETEADTLGNVLKQDWGGYSDLLRKAFSGESLSQSRRTEDEFALIENTQLAVALTGTPRQILRLIPSAEDGLFSRFLFYTYNTPPIWQDVSPKNQKADLHRHFEEKSKEVLKMIHFWQRQQVDFQLQEHQWHYLNLHFQQLLTKAHAFYGPSAEATIKRGGNLLFRIAMVLSACRQYQDNTIQKKYLCQETDFQIAFQLISTYLEHALFLLEKLPIDHRIQFSRLPNHKRAFFEALPREFKRKEAVALGLQYNMKTRTIDQLLKELLGVSLEQNGYGIYQKT